MMRFNVTKKNFFKGKQLKIYENPKKLIKIMSIRKKNKKNNDLYHIVFFYYLLFLLH